jgi:hypothetical protein
MDPLERIDQLAMGTDQFSRCFSTMPGVTKIPEFAKEDGEGKSGRVTWS